jgi:glycosyl-4,4'-diaponeurosporenoate acyltransferase
VKAWLAVVMDSTLWAGWGAVVGLVGSKLPAQRFATDGPLTPLRPWERGGRLWAAVGLRHWKRFVPELAWLSGGVRKKHLLSGADGRHRLEAETRQAEVVHWAACLPILVMPIWGPPWVFSAMALYAFCANAPCIVIQRYNRGRLMQLSSRRATRPISTIAEPDDVQRMAREIVG